MAVAMGASPLRVMVLHVLPSIASSIIVRTTIGMGATILNGARIGKNCRIFPGAVISAVPQDLKFAGEETIVKIGNNTTINSKVAQGKVGSYGGVDSNNTDTQILTSDVGNSVAALTPTLAGGNNYTLIAYGFSGATRVSQLQESQDAPDSGKAKVLATYVAEKGKPVATPVK